LASLVVVGAGPAGLRAAAAVVAAGLRPVLVDEGRQVGGQGYRAPSPGLALDMRALMGSEVGKYQRIHALFARIRDQIDYRPETLVWAVQEGVLHVASDGRTGTIPYDALLLATGARDRVVPLPGWTLPGVFSLGGAQVVLKDQGCFIGRRVVFLGSSPLLALVARQYHQLGADVAAVLDTTPLAAKLSAWRDLLASPRTLARGLADRARLGGAGAMMLDGVRPLAIGGTDRVESVRFIHGGAEKAVSCDAVGLGYGLASETQLAELAGARFHFDPVFRQWLPQIDRDGRAGPGLYLAGDGAAIGGADTAEASGALAALTVLADLGRACPERDRARLRRQVERLRRFQSGLARAFAWPAGQAAALSDDTLVCRCEAVMAGEIRAALAAPLGPREINRVKAITRCGMGRCQGRFCAPALQEIVAAATGRPVAEVGRLRGQAPVKPVPLDLGVDA
jgi:NADPH-dependent 2,4-dienoyl-CoA reductase/sulfur reductase-like enzyme